MKNIQSELTKEILLDNPEESDEELRDKQNL